jgi:regulator of protease activity HflC (stomatin/prohibitin superfamily)
MLGLKRERPSDPQSELTPVATLRPKGSSALSLSVSPRTMRRTIGGLVALFLVLFFWRTIFVPIGSGQAGVLWSRFGGGTLLNKVYQEGYRVKYPWDSMAVYDLRLRKMQEDVTVLTRDGLEVSMTVTARFAPRRETLPLLHQKMGPDYRDTVVWPDVLAAVRSVVRQFKPEDLRVLGEEKLSEQINAAAKADISPYLVDLDRILITKVHLPETVQNAIQEKLAQEQKVLTYDFLLKQAELEKQRRLVEADGIREFEALSHVSILKWRGIEVTDRLANSPHSKVVVIGNGDDKLPILLSGEK